MRWLCILGLAMPFSIGIAGKHTWWIWTHVACFSHWRQAYFGRMCSMTFTWADINSNFSVRSSPIWYNSCHSTYRFYRQYHEQSVHAVNPSVGGCVSRRGSFSSAMALLNKSPCPTKFSVLGPNYFCRARINCSYRYAIRASFWASWFLRSVICCSSWVFTFMVPMINAIGKVRGINWEKVDDRQPRSNVKILLYLWHQSVCDQWHQNRKVTNLAVLRLSLTWRFVVWVI